MFPAEFLDRNLQPLSPESVVKKRVSSFSKEDLVEKKVFVRLDLTGVVLNDDLCIADDTEIQAAVPTIKYLMERQARVILASHLGPSVYISQEYNHKYNRRYSLKPLVARLSQLLEVEVKMANDCIGPDVEKMVHEMLPGGVLLLENLRFHREEVRNETGFVIKLASLADLYVNDSFGTAHESYASTVGVPQYLKPAVAGLLMEKELRHLSIDLAKPKRPFAAIVGGSKLSTKFDLIENLLEKVDILILGGDLIFTFYKARNLSVGFSLVEDHMINLAKILNSKANQKGICIRVPDDVVIADKFSAAAKSEVVPSAKIPDNWIGLDIGPKAISRFEKVLGTAKTILWNGPMGVSEYDKFAAGTEAIAKKLAELSGTGVKTIVVGGETIAAVRKMRLADKMSHISMGGSASLKLLEGIPLPGVMALDDDTIEEKTGLPDTPDAAEPTEQVGLADKMSHIEL